MVVEDASALSPAALERLPDSYNEYYGLRDAI